MQGFSEKCCPTRELPFKRAILCPTSSVQKVVPRPGYCGPQLVITQRVKELENMSDGEENADTRHSCEDKQQLEKEIDKEIHKLKYFRTS